METAKSLQQQAYEHLKDLIYQDFFSYDQIYSETRVAKEMGISRTPFIVFHRSAFWILFPAKASVSIR